MIKEKDTLKRTFAQLTSILDQEVTSESKERIVNKLYEQMPDSSNIKESAAELRDESEQIGGGLRLTHN